MDSMRAGARGALDLLLEAAKDGRLDDICSRLDIGILGAFGSAVGPGAGPANDLDIAVEFNAEPREIELIDELVRITGFDHIDLATINGAGPTLKARALVGTPLFEDVPGRYALTQMAALAEYRDTAPLRQLQLDSLTK